MYVLVVREIVRKLLLKLRLLLLIFVPIYFRNVLWRRHQRTQNIWKQPNVKKTFHFRKLSLRHRFLTLRRASCNSLCFPTSHSHSSFLCHVNEHSRVTRQWSRCVCVCVVMAAQLNHNTHTTHPNTHTLTHTSRHLSVVMINTISLSLSTTLLFAIDKAPSICVYTLCV